MQSVAKTIYLVNVRGLGMNYDISDLDDSGQVKPGFFLLLVMVFLSRQFLYGPLALLASRKGRGGSGANIDVSWLAINTYWEFFACIPALFMVLVLLRRKADAANWVRRGWHKGRLILLTATVLQVAAIAVGGISHEFNMHTATLIVLIIHFYIFVYLFRTQRVKDVFSMFPENNNTALE